jgi:CRISPR/Cas system-associated protein endoribonuclease Cas2
MKKNRLLRIWIIFLDIPTKAWRRKQAKSKFCPLIKIRNTERRKQGNGKKKDLSLVFF